MNVAAKRWAVSFRFWWYLTLFIALGIVFTEWRLLPIVGLGYLLGQFQMNAYLHLKHARGEWDDVEDV